MTHKSTGKPRKTVRIWPDQAKKLKKIPREKLIEAIRGLPPQPPAERAALRVKMPRSLVDALYDAKQTTRMPEQELIVWAARIYRQQRPSTLSEEELEREAHARPPLMFDNADQDLKARTLQLEPEDRKLIQHLGRGTPGVPHRRAAFEELARIIRNQSPSTLPDRRDAERVTINLVPDDELMKAIQPHLDNGWKFTAILTRALEYTAK